MKKLTISLVTDVPPDRGYTAGQVLARIIEHTPQAVFRLHWINQSNLPSNSGMPPNCTMEEHISLTHGRVTRWMRHHAFKMCAKIPRVRGAVNAGFAVLPPLWAGARLGLKLRLQHVDIVWLSLQGEKPAIVFTLVSLLSGKKFILQQWDPISWWTENRQHPTWLTNLAKRLVNRLEHRAALNLVPSDVWRDQLLSQQKHALKIDNFFTAAEIDTARIPLRVNSPLEINAVFVGQFYSNGELLQLLKLLKHDAQLMGRSVVLHYFGSSVSESKALGIRIVNHGHVSREELIQRIAKWDLALLPYPTNPRFDDTSRLSFPSKSRIYLAAGLPILAYCKPDSSPQLFFGKHYLPHFHNIRGDNPMRDFLSRAVNPNIEIMLERSAVSRALMAAAFSESTELVPVHQFLETLS